MANKILHKRSSVQGKVPLTGDLDLGELAINTRDGKLYLKKDDGIASIVEVSYNDAYARAALSAGTGVSYNNTTGQISIGQAVGTTDSVTFANLTVTGNFHVDGTVTSVNSTSMVVEDKNIELGKNDSPTDITADGGGITLVGTTDKTFNWYDATDAWTSSEHLDLASGKVYRIGGVNVLSGTALGAGVTSSSLTSVGTITAGTWKGTVIDPQYGGTGINNAGKTITLGGNFATSGAFPATLTLQGSTNVTLPTTGTLATTGKLNQFALTSSSELASVISDETGTGLLVFGTGPTLTNPTINAGTGVLVLPGALSPSQTDNGSIVWDSDNFLLTVGNGTSRKIMVDTDTAQTLSGKTISGASNTISNIGNGSLVNSELTIGNTSVSLGGNVTALSGLTSVAATNFTGLASSATKLATGRTISITGDIAYTSGSFDGTSAVTGVATLANTTVVAGTYGSSSSVAQITVDAKGRATTVSNVAISLASSAISDFTEAVQDTTAGFILGSNGVGTTYNDVANTLTISTNATSANTVSTIVSRDASGNFSAGTITASLTGNVTGTATNVTGVVAVANGGTGASTAATARTNLGLAIGTDVQGYSGALATIANIASTDGNFIVGNGTTWVAESGAAARTSLGLGSIATQNANTIALTGGTINGTSVGATTRSTGAFTTLTSNGATTFTANTASVSTGTGTLVVTGGVGVSGDLYVGGVMNGVASSAQYADLAENYEGDAAIEPGTVVEFGGDKEVTACGHDMCTAVAGVVSTNPAYLMNHNLEADHVIAVAFTGRVPCKVQGAVRKGDLMVSAGNGRARAEANPRVGSVIGKALENFDGTEGVIEVVVGRF